MWFADKYLFKIYEAVKNWSSLSTIYIKPTHYLCIILFLSHLWWHCVVNLHSQNLTNELMDVRTIQIDLIRSDLQSECWSAGTERGSGEEENQMPFKSCETHIRWSWSCHYWTSCCRVRKLVVFIALFGLWVPHPCLCFGLKKTSLVVTLPGFKAAMRDLCRSSHLFKLNSGFVWGH